MPTVLRHLAVWAGLACFLAACGGAAPAASPVASQAAAAATPTAGPPVRGLAVVTGLDVTAGQAQVRGELGDACTTLAEAAVARTGQTFVITIHTARPAGAACAAVVAPFEQTIALDTAGLPGGTYVVVANGVSAQFTLEGAASPTAPPAPTDLPTPTPAPVDAAAVIPTTAPTAAPTLAPTTAPAVANCVNQAAFDRDVTIPDRTVLKAGQKFVKTWRVQNSGTCVWQNYQLIFDNGARMGAPLSLPMPAVKPGEYVELTVDMTAPAEGGSHIGRWQFQTPAGQRFGLSVPNEGLLWVWIDVSYVGAAAPAAVAPAASAPSGGGTSACGATEDAGGEAQILSAINSARAQNGLPALNLNGQLNAAAWRHAQDMACNGINSINPHRGSDGTSWKERVSQAGFTGSLGTLRENVYYGGSTTDAFSWWMNSQIHRDNILSGSTDIGLAYAVRPGSEWTNYYTLIFGQP